MSKQAEEKEEAGEKATPVSHNYQKKFSREAHRKAVSLQPRRSRWTMLWYVVIFVVAFWFLHYVMKIG